MAKATMILMGLILAIWLIAIEEPRACASCHEATPRGLLDLGAYGAQTQARAIPGIRDNLSGITFHPGSGTLFGVLNAPPQVVELSRHGELLRIIPLLGFDDTEGISHVGGDRFAVLEERNSQVVLIQITAGTKEVSRSEVGSITVDFHAGGNVGFEGICHDGREGIFLAHEARPQALYHMARLPSSESATQEWIQLTRPYAAETLGVSDLAGLHRDALTGHLLILSERSKRLLEVSPEGLVLHCLHLTASHAGLAENIPQPEGVARDAAGRLYIVSEPNLLYVLTQR